ncbi:hypothetical protein ACFDTO_07420 [Microbacteriaceae bacterium 4G12]
MARDEPGDALIELRASAIGDTIGKVTVASSARRNPDRNARPNVGRDTRSDHRARNRFFVHQLSIRGVSSTYGATAPVDIVPGT